MTDQTEDLGEFDYVVIGSGAGGGPLAARLALGGKKVCVLEAGGNPDESPPSPAFPQSSPGEVHRVPGYHAASTEDPSMAWMFSVRHYEDTGKQAQDAKYNRAQDPNSPPGVTYPIPTRFFDPKKGDGKGIFYPRSSGLGGCTGHHAMIMIAPNDRDWDGIADLTGDETWRSSRMRGYFAKMEQCLYYEAYDKAFGKFLGGIYGLWQKLIFFLNPRLILDRGGHGSKGWQPTGVIDPLLIESIAKEDKAFFTLLARTVIGVLERDRPLVRMLKKALFTSRIIQYLDPNDQNTRRTKAEGVFLIPAGIAGGAAAGASSSDSPGESKDSQAAHRGERYGVQNFLLATEQALLDSSDPHRGKLVIKTGYHVVRIEWKDGEQSAAREIKSLFAHKGKHLYAASPLQVENPSAAPRVELLIGTHTEVILAGGAFNTPQLLMLSGVGDRSELAKHDIEPKIHLPGVGRNLQDRYEVTVISEMKEPFKTLDGITFRPGDETDKGLADWRSSRSGLYATNGGALAIMRRSAALGPDEREPDTFTFGAPVAFRGYYWNWSRELLRRKVGGTEDQRNLWTWVILKAYTGNNAGTVKLRSGDPFEPPEICFRSFEEGPQEASEKDLKALMDTIKFFRQVNGKNEDQFKEEIQPGTGLADDSEGLKEWVKTQAWGHHACGTCRMGSDRWRADTSQLADAGAVIDSEFRVHGAQRLRVVDASIFPQIPGYFILAPILMVSEKAADLLLASSTGSSEVYPEALHAKEMEAIRQRREKAGVPASDKAIGLALSGGGVRSATFSLGVLQALAKKDLLRRVDVLSTVSGGGYIGSFLGRLFTRPLVSRSADPARRVQDILTQPSGSINWLRTQANYIAGRGTDDLRINLGVYLRNIVALHLVMGALFFCTFGVFRIASDWLVKALPALSHHYVFSSSAGPSGIEISPWWPLPVVLVAVAVIPSLLGYWLAPKAGSVFPHPVFSLGAWIILIAGAGSMAILPGGLWYAFVCASMLFLAWVWQELARRGTPDSAEQKGTIVRNRLTRALGEMLILSLLLTAGVALDTAARATAYRDGIVDAVKSSAAWILPLVPVLKKGIDLLISRLSSGSDRSAGAGLAILPQALAAIVSISLLAFLLFCIDLSVHRLVKVYPAWILTFTIIAGLFSLAVGYAFNFLNLSSLQSSYAARLVRTYQGATNPARIFESAGQANADVQASHSGDDIPFTSYHPEANGGPLHLVNVCINETIDNASQREVPDRKGIAMCLSSLGVTVGRRFHSLWVPLLREDLSKWGRFLRRLEGRDFSTGQMALKAVTAPEDPDGFHVLATRKASVAPVENLTLGQWIGISGAAFGTGLGRGNGRGASLLLGLTNGRLGYWWNSGIRAGDRPGRYPQSLWRKLKRWPSFFFPMQSLLVAEWGGVFGGPSHQLWPLSDGGHFENLGIYELIRRRLPLIIATDGSADPHYLWNDLARMEQQIRQDFDAKIKWYRDPRRAPDLPPWIDALIDPQALGSIESIGQPHKEGTGLSQACSVHAIIGCVKWGNVSCDSSWIILLKASLTGDESPDILSYAGGHSTFPHQTTADQIFDDQQWESYRALGEHIGEGVFK